MPVWKSLGTVTPKAFEWQLFELPSYQRTFRFTFTGDLNRIWYFARMRQYFSSSEVGVSQRLYPKPQQVIVEMPIPAELAQAGVFQRSIGIAKFPYRRWTVLDSDWIVELEELIG
ncbi:MAG: hypothetical protein HC769_36435 [Cyanobacteria bacterium CRU_2_1]|nr:hypothetical protein [Cyanobacteria bacterium CRU_2_1]